MTQQQKVYALVFEQGYNLTETAQQLGLTQAEVRAEVRAIYNFWRSRRA